MTAPRRALTLGLAVALGLLTAACGGSGSRLVEEAPARFAGMDRRTLNACAGTPTAVEDAAGGTVLHYEMSSARQVDIPRPDPGPGRVGSASDALPPPPFKRFLALPPPGEMVSSGIVARNAAARAFIRWTEADASVCMAIAALQFIESCNCPRKKRVQNLSAALGARARREKPWIENTGHT